MSSFIQQLKRIAYLPPQIIQSSVIEPFSSAEEMTKYIAFMYYRTFEEQQQLYQDNFFVVPLGALNECEYYCLFQRNKNHNRQPWALHFIGTASEIAARVAPMRFNTTLPHYPNALAKYNTGLFTFAYVPPAAFSRLEGLYDNGIPVRENIEARFRECYQTGTIVFKETGSFKNAAFSLGVLQDNKPIYAVFAPNRNQNLQEWYCVGFLPLDEVHGFESSDFDDNPNTSPNINTGNMIRAFSERPKVFLVYGMDPITHHPPSELMTLKHLLLGKNIEPIDLAAEEHGSEAIIEAFERRADQCKFALIIYTPADEGFDMNWERNSYRSHEQRIIYYPRQNVVFETGYFMGKLGRDKVRVLLQKRGKNLAIPSDIRDLFYIDMDNYDWTERMFDALRREGIIN